MPANRDNRPLIDISAIDWHDARTHPRAMPLPPPTTDIHDSPVYCLRVNQEWFPHVIGMVGQLLEHRSWDGTELERSDAIRQIEKMLAEFSQPCVLIGDTMLRQNPDNPCLLEQSFNGGLSWEPAFDFNLCRDDNGTTILTEINLSNEINTFVENNQNTWNANPTINNFAPVMVFDGSPQDSNRNVAICYAAQQLVILVMEAVLKEYEDGTPQNLVSFIVGVIGAAVGFAVGGFAGAIAGAIISSDAMKTVFKLEAELDRAIMMGLRDDFICAIYSALKDDNLTRTNFENAFLTAGWSPGSNQAIYSAILQPLMDDLDVWLAFLKLCIEGFQLQDYGIVVPCECMSWEHTIDLKLTDWGMVVTQIGDPPVQGGQYTPGVGWETTNVLYNGGSGSEGRTFCSILKTFEKTTITKFEIELNLSFGTWADTTRPAMSLVLRNFEEGNVGGFGYNRNQLSSGDEQSFLWTGEEIVSEIEFWMRTSRDVTSPYVYDGHGEAITIVIGGKGFDPFATGGPVLP